MAEGKKSFVFYNDWRETFKQLPKDKGYDLLMHLLAYVDDEDPETDDVLINAVFVSIKNTLKRDLKKYKKRAQTSRDNGMKGGRPIEDKTQETQQDKSEPKKPDSVSVSVSDTASDNDKKNVRKSTQKKSAGKSGKYDYVDSIIEIFCKKYSALRGDVYEIMNRGKERTAAGKLAAMHRKKFPEDKTEEALEKMGVLFELCINIDNEWLHTNMSLPIINSKFNEIRQHLKNEKDRGNNKSGISDERIGEIILNTFVDEKE